MERELKDKEVKIKREMEQIFFKPINLSIDDMEKFDQKDMDKKRPIKNTWYYWLINCIPEAITKISGGFQDKVVSLFKKNAIKLMVKKKTHMGELKKTNKTENTKTI